MGFGPVIKALHKAWKNLINGIFPTENTFCWTIHIEVLGQSNDLVLILEEIPLLKSFRSSKVSPLMGMHRHTTESRSCRIFLDSHFLILKTCWIIPALNQHTSGYCPPEKKISNIYGNSNKHTRKCKITPNSWVWFLWAMGQAGHTKPAAPHSLRQFAQQLTPLWEKSNLTQFRVYCRIKTGTSKSLCRLELSGWYQQLRKGDLWPLGSLGTEQMRKALTVLSQNLFGSIFLFTPNTGMFNIYPSVI